MDTLSKTLISEIMSTNILTVTPNENLLDACQKMSKINVGSAIVINENIAGIITERDILHHIAKSKGDLSHKTVRDVMTKNVLCIDINQTLESAGNIMGEKEFRHLPVTQNNQVVGILSARDIFKAFHGQDTIKIKQLEAVKAMAVTYAHEINNPLTIISGSLRSLNKEFEHAKIDLANKNVIRITEVIRKIMDLRTVSITNYSSECSMVTIEDDQQTA